MTLRCGIVGITNIPELFFQLIRWNILTVHCIMHCTGSEDGGYANGLRQSARQEEVMRGRKPGLSNGIPIWTVGLYSVCWASTNQMDLKSKIDSVNMEMISLLSDLVYEMLSELRRFISERGKSGPVQSTQSSIWWMTLWMMEGRIGELVRTSRRYLVRENCCSLIWVVNEFVK